MKNLFDLLNNNQWVVTVLIFILTILISWLVWLFGYIRHKPKLKISPYSPIIPNFFVNDWLKTSKQKEGDRNVERIVFLLWLSISNLGFSSTTIASYRLEYRDISWKKHKLIPMSLPEPLSHSLWNYVKVFPSITTNYPHLWISNSWKIDVGSSILWFLYFNIEYYWDYKPKMINNIIYANLYIEDIYWKKFRFKIKFINKDIEYLSKYANPEILLNHSSYEEALDI